MSKVICIMGESGSGKTTSMRNLDATTTYYIDADRKGLSWRNWRTQYNKKNKNYSDTNDPKKVMTLIKGISDSCPHFTIIVVDTLNGIMVGDEMRRCREKGYDKWQDMAQCIWDLADVAPYLREDLTIIFTAHSQSERDDSGFVFTRIRTSGKKLDKIVLESKFTTVLYAKCSNGKYVFETHSNNSTAKTPLEAFSENEIENDIVKVLDRLKEF